MALRSAIYPGSPPAEPSAQQLAVDAIFTRRHEALLSASDTRRAAIAALRAAADEDLLPLLRAKNEAEALYEARMLDLQKAAEPKFTVINEAFSTENKDLEAQFRASLAGLSDFAAWVMQHWYDDYPSQCRIILSHMPTTLEALDRLARVNQWCDTYWGRRLEAHRSFRREAIAAGFFTEPEPTRAAYEIIDVPGDPVPPDPRRTWVTLGDLVEANRSEHQDAKFREFIRGLRLGVPIGMAVVLLVVIGFVAFH